MSLFEPNIDKLEENRNIGKLIRALSYKKERSVRWEAAKALGRIGSTKAVKSLIAALRDEEHYVRGRAVEALGKIGDTRAVEPLIAVLEDDNYEVRRKTAKSLGNIGNTKAIKPLIVSLSDKKDYVRWEAAEALGKIGAPAEDLLISALSLDNPYVQKGAAKALGYIGNVKGVKPLIDTFRNCDDFVRSEIVEALGIIKDSRAVELLINALEDEDVTICGRAVEALGSIGDIRTVEPLLTKLWNKRIRSHIVNALDKLDWKPDKTELGTYYWIEKLEWKKCAKIGEPAVGPLIAAIKEKKYIFSREESVRSWAEVTGSSMTEAKFDLFSREFRDIQPIVKALISIGLPAVELLIDALSDKSEFVRYCSARALGAIGDAQAVKPLIETLKKDNNFVRSGAVDALKNMENSTYQTSTYSIIKDSTAMELLIKLLGYQNADIRKTAFESLKKTYSNIEKLLTENDLVKCKISQEKIDEITRDLNIDKHD